MTNLLRHGPADTFAIAAVGLPPGWQVEILPASTLSVAPGATQPVTIRLIPGDAPPRAYRVSITLAHTRVTYIHEVEVRLTRQQTEGGVGERATQLWLAERAAC